MFLTFTKKVLSVKRADMRKLVAAARTRTGEKRCEQQLRRVDKALSRAGDILAESWICLSHRNLILAEDKPCSSSSSWGHGKILSKRLIPDRLFAVFDEVGKNSVIEYKSGTNWCNKCSILADKEIRVPPHVHSQEAKKSDIRK